MDVAALAAVAVVMAVVAAGFYMRGLDDARYRVMYYHLAEEYSRQAGELRLAHQALDRKLAELMVPNGFPPVGMNPNGLHSRYLVAHASCKPIEPGALYWLLRLDSGANASHMEASREAADLYAQRILDDDGAGHLHQMARELRQLVQLLDEGQVPSWQA